MATGCLNDAQIEEVRTAAPGQVPVALAQHLAACEACQARALFGERRKAPSGRRPELPTARRAALLGVLVLAAFLAFFWTLLKLAGRVQ